MAATPTSWAAPTRKTTRSTRPTPPPVISSDNPDPSVVGEAVTIAYSVTVDSPGTGSPTGTVTVSDADSAQFCSASVAAGSCQITFEEAGTHHLTATLCRRHGLQRQRHVAEDHLVNTRHTSTQVLCVPSSIVVAQATTCTRDRHR